ncbi:GrpB family protein [Mycetocola zhadangensis]|uniref:GrpB family protein n=1 Tax=Mycetocola zhadangensis TaxID=1164595 RepID=A0A3L7J1K6_9MICO|nr:GrpB family protein [Mycetocola zhadangensis]RLQ84279.1 GrpB family protein [Mycetocola zhadangensis]GGE94434.1 hypothetical protein GCM10011313_16760 [Mycetocola zhadangensis]
MVTVVPYSSDWPIRFAEQAQRLRAALGTQIIAIEHIGSTAIPGLPAKPVIDIAACTASNIDPFSLGPAIESLGYQEHRTGPKNHAIFVRGTDSGRTEILHVFSMGEWELCNQRVFRDKLMHDATARERYAALKIYLGATLVAGKAYTLAKRGLIQDLLNEEREARGLQPTVAWDK